MLFLYKIFKFYVKLAQNLIQNLSQIAPEKVYANKVPKKVLKKGSHDYRINNFFLRYFDIFGAIFSDINRVCT